METSFNDAPPPLGVRRRHSSSLPQLQGDGQEDDRSRVRWPGGGQEEAKAKVVFARSTTTDFPINEKETGKVDILYTK